MAAQNKTKTLKNGYVHMRKYPTNFLSGHICNPSLLKKVEYLSFYSPIEHDKSVDPCMIFPIGAH